MREATRFTEGFPLGPPSTFIAKNRGKRHKEKLNFFAIAHQYFSNNTRLSSIRRRGLNGIVSSEFTKKVNPRETIKLYFSCLK
jgi:hypothetical protein